MKRLIRLLNKNKRVKNGLIIFGCFMLTFILTNLILFFVYQNKTYPGTKVKGQVVGSISRSALQQKLSSMSLLPEKFVLTYKDKSVDVYTAQLGVTVDTDQTASRAVAQRTWLPIVNFVQTPSTDVILKSDQKTFDETTARLAEMFKKDPADAKVVTQNGTFVIVAESDGYNLNKDNFKSAVQDSLNKGTNTVVVPVLITNPKVKQVDLSTGLQDLKERQQVSVTIRYKDKTKKLTPQEILDLHEPSGTTYILTDAKIRSFVNSVGRSFGIGVQNSNDAVRDIKSSIQNNKTLDFTLVPAPLKTYTYCTAARGVNSSELTALDSKLASTYANPGGWGLGGQVAFVKVASGCNMTVWLASADQMPTFGSICDSLWSCTVYPNVIINYDRWRGASDAWNGSGGNLDDYRSMVINHETGHWLGFGHQNCSGAGQLAPVMQQQSINLQGCKFNPWPLPSEAAALRSRLGL